MTTCVLTYRPLGSECCGDYDEIGALEGKDSQDRSWKSRWESGFCWGFLGESRLLGPGIREDTTGIFIP